MSHDDRLPHLLGMTSAELMGLAESFGQPAFRGRQIADWLYKRSAHTVDEMTDLPSSFRDTLRDACILRRHEIVSRDISSDHTTKFLLALEDRNTVESVLLPYADRVSVCLSTQVGCAMACAFCATAVGGLVRDLRAGEIVDQALTLQSESPGRITHVVYMGMGEPLLNYDNVVRSIHLLNEEVGIGQRHMTISTVGIVPRILQLADEGLQVTLAISLHAPNDTLRKTLMPAASTSTVRSLVQACRAYAEKTHRRVTFEYLLIRDVNDSQEHARELASLLKGLLCNVNLIPYNEVESLGFKRPGRDSIQSFRAVLEGEGTAVTQRMERGHSISAACGQLRRRSETP